MKLLRGSDELGIEDACFYVVPDGWGGADDAATHDEESAAEFAAKAVVMQVAKENGFPMGLFGERNREQAGVVGAPPPSTAGGGVGVVGVALVAVVGVAVGVVGERRGLWGSNGGYQRVADTEANFKL